MKINIGILFGGKSVEHEVSCISAYNIYKNIDKSKFSPYLLGISKEGKFFEYNGDIDKLLSGEWINFDCDKCVVELERGLYVKNNTIKIDCVFPALHGLYGEDGRIQGLLDYINIKYVGNRYLSSAVCMDKSFAKDILKKYKINQTNYFTINKKIFSNFDIEVILSKFCFPMFVKPSNSGSSIGISKVNSKEELCKSIEIAFLYDERVIIEEGIDARELEVAVLETKENMIISDVGELIFTDNDFYDYNTKYNKNTTKYSIPAVIDDSLKLEILYTAKRVFEILNCRGLARIDFFIDKKTNTVLLNEVNTMPGFTVNSMYPKLLENMGISFSETITKLIEFALEA